MKKTLVFLAILAVSSCAVWLLAGRYYSFRLTSPSGEFLYNAGVSLSMQSLISLAWGLVFSLALFLSVKLNKKIAIPLVTLVSFLFVGLLLANWMFGTRPDGKLSDDPDIIRLMSGPSADSHASSSEVGVATSSLMSSAWVRYTHPTWKLSFDTPAGLDVRMISTSTRQTLIGPIELNSGSDFEPDSIEIPGLFIVSKMLYSTLAKSPIVDWQSCCSGIRYWYDVGNKEWRAEQFQNSTLSMQEGGGVIKKTSVYPLVESDRCTLEERFGRHYFYKITSTEEGVPIDISYFLNTDKGYAIRFSSLHDIHTEIRDGTSVTAADIDMLNAMERILTSTNADGAPDNTRAGCR